MVVDQQQGLAHEVRVKEVIRKAVHSRTQFILIKIKIKIKKKGKHKEIKAQTKCLCKGASVEKIVGLRF